MERTTIDPSGRRIVWQVRIDTDTLDRLAAVADRTGCSKSELTRRFLRSGLDILEGSAA